MSVGKALIYLGVVLCGIGMVLAYRPGLISWFGRLPGDIRIQGEGRYVFIPGTSMIVVSVLLSLLINWLLRR
jgi:hypothetical protein